MPHKLFVFHSLGIILQYSIVMLLFYFLYKVVKLSYLEMVQQQQPLVTHSSPEDVSTESVVDARLIVVDPGQVQFDQTSFILGDSTVLGRHKGNTLVIDETFVSNEHACITRYKKGYMITDLHSTNGTFLNKAQLTEETLLASGDIIAIGGIIFRFEVK